MAAMETPSGKRIAKVRLALTERTVEALEPADKPWIAWGDRLTGFGVRVQPSRTKSLFDWAAIGCRLADGGLQFACEPWHSLWGLNACSGGEVEDGCSWRRDIQPEGRRMARGRPKKQ